MQIKINDAPVDITANSSLQDLLAHRKLSGTPIIIVLNNEIVLRENWTGKMLSPGDSLEIVRLIGGG